MKANRIIVAHNPDGQINSISIMDFRHASVSTIMAKPDLIKLLHAAILDSDFRVNAPITVESSNIDAISALTDDADDGPLTEYAMLGHYLGVAHSVPSPFKSFNSYAKYLNVKGLVYLIQHVDRRDNYQAEYAMGVQYINDKNSTVHLTLDPVEFLNLISNGRFIFCGEIYTSNCLRKPGEINNQLAITVDRKIAKIMQRISGQSSDRSLDAIFL